MTATSPFSVCKACGSPADLTRINGEPWCPEHIDAGMAELGRQLREIRDAARAWLSS